MRENFLRKVKQRKQRERKSRRRKRRGKFSVGRWGVEKGRNIWRRRLRQYFTKRKVLATHGSNCTSFYIFYTWYIWYIIFTNIYPFSNSLFHTLVLSLSLSPTLIHCLSLFFLVLSPFFLYDQSLWYHLHITFISLVVHFPWHIKLKSAAKNKS